MVETIVEQDGKSTLLVGMGDPDEPEKILDSAMMVLWQLMLVVLLVANPNRRVWE